MSVRFVIALCLASCTAAWGQDSLNVTRVGQISESGAQSIAVSGDYAYVAAGYNGLRIVNITNPSLPVEVGAATTPDFAWDVGLSGNYAYVAAAGSGLRVIDISDPANPVEVAFWDTPSSERGLVVSGNRAYVAEYNWGLSIFDISNPQNPDLLGTQFPTSYGFDVAQQGNYAYIAAGAMPNQGLWIIDVSNPYLPDRIGRYSTAGFAAFDVSVQGDYAYIATSPGFSILDISNPAAPALVSSVSTPYGVSGIAISGNNIYIAGLGGGLRIFDASDLFHPLEIAFYDTQGSAKHTFISSNIAYVADNDFFGIYDFSAALVDNPIPRGYMQLVKYGPPNWGYRLFHFYGFVNKVIFTDFCHGTIGSLTGAAAANWTVMSGGDGNDGDTIIFLSDVPLTTGLLDTFWLTQSWCAGIIEWCVGDICSEEEGPLPVEFLGLNAIPGDREVALEWRTASEQNNDHFEIQRDGIVAATISSHGNSAVERFYTWTDSNLNNGQTYRYTLSGVAINGDRIELRSVDATPPAGGIVTSYKLYGVYPNPFNSSAQIRFEVPRSSRAQLRVFDLQGRLVETLASRIFDAGEHTVNFNGENRASGMYIVQMSSGEFSTAQKIVLLK